MTLAVLSVCEMVATMMGSSFYVRDNTVVFAEHGFFFYGFFAYGVIYAMLATKVRHHLFHRIMGGIYGTLVVSLLVLLVQGLNGQTSFTVSAFLFPLIAIMYTMHSNPYNAMLGTNNMEAMQDYLHSCRARGSDFVLLSLYLRDFETEGAEIPEPIQAQVRQLVYELAKKAHLFRVGNGHMVLVMLKRQYPQYRERIRLMLDKPECSVHVTTPKDMERFRRSEYILAELTDIYRRQDLDDPRVLAFCQPVLNVRTGCYDTAEALMRLELTELGIVYPDQFIHLAEEQGIIHVLTEIILHKTCEAIRDFCEQGLAIKRISVNVAVSELKDDNFCNDVLGIIDRSGDRLG